jgi:hypothetical protein
MLLLAPHRSVSLLRRSATAALALLTTKNAREQLGPRRSKPRLLTCPEPGFDLREIGGRGRNQTVLSARFL